VTPSGTTPGTPPGSGPGSTPPGSGPGSTPPGSGPGSGPAPDLSETLAALAAVGARAGLDEAAVRAEGAALAAAVAESAPGAPQEWAAEVGSDVQGFFDSASSGRRWRESPTAGLAALVTARSPAAGEYARALVEVTAAACGLGEPTVRVIANASIAAGAQLRSTGVPTPASLTSWPLSTNPLSSNPPSPNPLSSNPFGTTPLLPTPAPIVVPQPDLPSLLADRAWVNEALSRLTPPPGAAPIQPTPLPEPPSAPVPQPEAPAQSAAGAATSTEAATAAAEPEEPPKTLEELLGELDELTGLTAVKGEIHRQAQLLRIEQLRAAAGLRSPTITRHLVFLGNPGTGKTTVARLVAGIYRALGLLSKGQLIEVDRSELVAGYLGQTAVKTAEVVASAIGGVLFVDEAYSLAGDQYGEEAIDTLVKEMEDHRDDLVVVVAGYPAPMQRFIEANPGLASRFRTVITFADYTDDELMTIFAGMAADSDYEPTPECHDRFREILAATPRGEGFGNGRFARNVLEAAIGRHAWRLRDVAEPTVAQLRELLPEDLSDADPPAGGSTGAEAGEGDAMPDVSTSVLRLDDPVPTDRTTAEVTSEPAAGTASDTSAGATGGTE
jgi:hypothetical protein